MYNYMAWYKVFCNLDGCDFFGVIIPKVCSGAIYNSLKIHHPQCKNINIYCAKFDPLHQYPLELSVWSRGSNSEYPYSILTFDNFGVDNDNYIVKVRFSKDLTWIQWGGEMTYPEDEMSVLYETVSDYVEDTLLHKRPTVNDLKFWNRTHFVPSDNVSKLDTDTESVRCPNYDEEFEKNYFTKLQQEVDAYKSAKDTYKTVIDTDFNRFSKEVSDFLTARLGEVSKDLQESINRAKKKINDVYGQVNSMFDAHIIDEDVKNDMYITVKRYNMYFPISSDSDALSNWIQNIIDSARLNLPEGFKIEISHLDGIVPTLAVVHEVDKQQLMSE